jgi:hypothetical protein
MKRLVPVQEVYEVQLCHFEIQPDHRKPPLQNSHNVSPDPSPREGEWRIRRNKGCHSGEFYKENSQKGGSVD